MSTDDARSNDDASGRDATAPASGSGSGSGDGPTDPIAASYQETYCVFEGGGAVGALHVGVLRALEGEPQRYALRGFAGASAGALVALLASAGFRGDQMIGSFADGDLPTILDALNDPEVATATALIGPDWTRVAFARRLIEGRIFPDGALLSAITLRRALLAYGVALLAAIAFSPWLLAALLAALIAGAGYVAYRFWIGLASLDRVHAKLRRLIAEKHGFEPDQPISFQKLQRQTGFKLNIVASNLTRRRMSLFSLETTPTACVVDAAIASIAIPFVFRPRKVAWRTGDGDRGVPELYCDGGLVSNLPAWSFESVQRVNRNAIIVTSELSGSTDDPKGSLGPLGYFTALARTAVFGGSDLNTRGLDRLIRVQPNDGSIGLLDLDIRKCKLAAAVEGAKLLAEARLLLERQLDSYAAAVRREAIDILAGLVGAPPDAFYVRAALAIQGRYRSKDLPFFRLAFCHGFGPFPDERASYPMADSVVGESLTHKIPIVVSLKDIENERSFRAIGGDGWAAKLSPPDLKWTLCMPMELSLDFEERQEKEQARWIAVTVDSNLDLDSEMLDEAAALIANRILEIVPEA